MVTVGRNSRTQASHTLSLVTQPLRYRSRCITTTLRPGVTGHDGHSRKEQSHSSRRVPSPLFLPLSSLSSSPSQPPNHPLSSSPLSPPLPHNSQPPPSPLPRLPVSPPLIPSHLGSLLPPLSYLVTMSRSHSTRKTRPAARSRSRSSSRKTRPADRSRSPAATTSRPDVSLETQSSSDHLLRSRNNSTVAPLDLRFDSAIYRRSDTNYVIVPTSDQQVTNGFYLNDCPCPDTPPPN